MFPSNVANNSRDRLAFLPLVSLQCPVTLWPRLPWRDGRWSLVTVMDPRSSREAEAPLCPGPALPPVRHVRVMTIQKHRSHALVSVATLGEAVSVGVG